MTYTATVGPSTKGPDHVLTWVVLVDDKDPVLSFKMNFRHDGTVAGLTNVVREYLTRRAHVDTVAKLPDVPEGTVLELVPPVLPIVEAKPSTQAELDQAAFFADLRQERHAQALAGYSADLQARYKPEYGLLG